MSHDAHNPTSGGVTPRELLDAYLDGMLQGAELAAFEQAIAADPALKAEVDAQRTINDSLSRLFHREEPVALPVGGNGTAAMAGSVAPLVAPPALRLTGDPTPANAGGGKVEAAAKGLSWAAKPISPLYAVAAVLVFALLAGLYVTGVINPEKWLNAPSLIAPEDVYARKVKNNFQPDWVCENDEQFVKNTKDYLDEPLLIKSTSSVEVVGWSYYEPVFSNGTVVLLTKVDGKEVILVMDRKQNDRKIKLSKESGLHDHPVVVGNATIHEISPFNTPRVIPLIERK